MGSYKDYACHVRWYTCSEADMSCDTKVDKHAVKLFYLPAYWLQTITVNVGCF